MTIYVNSNCKTKFTLNSIPIFCVYLVCNFLFLGCSTESLNDNELNHQQSTIDNMLYNCTDSIALHIGYAVGNFFDELSEDGIATFENRLALWNQQFNSNQFTLEQAKTSIAQIFDMSYATSSGYIDAIVDNHLYITNPSNRIKIIEAIGCYAELNGGSSSTFSANDTVESRWIFSTIANLLGADDCSFWTHAAGVADTAILAGAAVSGGGPLAAAGAISSYADTVNNAVNCCCP